MSNTIALPSGGGALQGIGEKFSPDLQTGTGNFVLPIALPPGRNGFQPELSLGYSTGNGNSHFGIGWGISVPGVSRKTSHGLPRYDDDRDVFILSGAEDLVAVERLPGVTRYRPRTEGLFARIEHHHFGINNFWRIWSKNGLVSFYGTPAPAEAGPDWQDPAVVADPNNRTRIFAWKLSLTLDPLGNRIEYEYDRDLGSEGPHDWDELYLRRIRYCDYSEETRFMISVAFDYEERPDPYLDYRAGFGIRARSRCRQITFRTHANEDRLVRTYHLTYLDQRDDLEDLESRLPLNRVSLLNRISVVGHDGDATEELPPVEFDYTRFDPDRRHILKLTGRELPAASLSSSDFELVDVIGNGLPDFFEMNGAARYWRNLGGGRFDLAREMRDAPAGIHLADPGVQMIDANGDGRIDLLVTRPEMSGYFPMRFGGLWDRRSFQAYRLAPSFDLRDPEVRLVDLDGDGVTDAIRAGSRLECFFNDPHLGWDETAQFERGPLEFFPDVNFSDPRVKLGDLTGDGLQDIILVYDGNIEYWPNLGYGNWGRRVSMSRCPRFPNGYDPKRILIGDLDGDGADDLVYVDHGSATLWINQGGNGWSDPIRIQGTPPVSDLDEVRLVDLLGTGVSGLLWCASETAPSRNPLFFLDFTGGVKPYLLHEMDNHLGAVTRIDYAPSTRFYLEDEQRLATRWKTPLPFPVQVVARVEVIDQISQGKLTTEYSYHHGYWDGAEREFRGFGRVEQLDTESFEEYNRPGLHGEQTNFERVDHPQHFSQPTLTKTWFHPGPVGDEFGEWEELDYTSEYWAGDEPFLRRPETMTAFLNGLPRRVKRDALRTMRGQILRTELYALDESSREARPYTVTESTSGIREESAPDQSNPDRRRIFFPHHLATRTTQWERGDDPMTGFAFADDYDAYGQPRAQVRVAIPRGRDFRLAAPPGDSYLATSAVAVYAQRDDETRYIVDRIAVATNFEILNDGSSAIGDFRDAIFSGAAERRVIGQTLSFYDGPEFEGLPLGQLGNYGASVRSENLVLNEEILQAAYRSGDVVSEPPEIPPYLVSNAGPIWTAEYPERFIDEFPALAGYIFYQGGVEAMTERGYFVVGASRRYDFQTNQDELGRGLILASRDPLGRETSITYDEFELLPVEIVNPAGLVTGAEYDYRALQPNLTRDVNGNRIAYAYTPMGLLSSVSLMGREGEPVGDTFDAPSTQFEYDFSAFTERQEPISVRTINRQHHINEGDAALPEGEETNQIIEYSDGFGRLVQTRIQAGDVILSDDIGLPIDQLIAVGDAVGQQIEQSRVAVSGWQRFDNKGRVIEKYEPFFSTGWVYARPLDAELGQSATLFYDPRGQLIRTVNPDGSEQRVIYGRPADLSDPEQFEPTPWETHTYDANDNAGRTHAAIATGYQLHWNTPISQVFDALGRAVETTDRNGADQATEWFVTRPAYDIRGNMISVTDELGRTAFRYIYDLADHELRAESIDAGLRRVVLNAAGAVVEQRDSKGALALQAYELLDRPVRLWARDAEGQSITLRQQLVYGDGADSGLTMEVARAGNLLGKIYQRYDEAGRLTFESYDFKGNLREKVRQVIRDVVILEAFEAPPLDWRLEAFSVDWQPAEGTTLAEHAGLLLDSTEYRMSMSYDALNRATLVRYPEDVEQARRELRPHYNRAGALERIELDVRTFVERIAYNAKGQRTLIAYGNGVMTRSAYDPQTFRLRRLRSERYLQSDELTYRPVGEALQDFAYEYDLAGNISLIRDRAANSGVPNSLLGTGALDRDFAYDPLYRLLLATGRECDLGSITPPWPAPFAEPRCADVTRARGYRERYSYDQLGNLLSLRHQVDGGGFTREFEMTAGSNRLATLTIGQTDFGYAYDASGNLTSETTSRHFEWDFANRMKVFRTQTEGAEPSVYAVYLYDSGGERVKKLVRRQGGQFEATIYIDGFFEHHRRVTFSEDQANNTLHVMDDRERIALARIGAPFPDDTTPALAFCLGDHLKSCNLVVGDTGNFISREEFTPYGETSFGGFAGKRYRLTGKERDEESGFNYHGARYYAPWLARWTSTDPGEIEDGPNLYRYVRNNPVIYVDPDGQSGQIVIDDAAKTLTVKMVFYTPAGSPQSRESANIGARFWNAQSDRWKYVVKTGKQEAAFVVKFEIEVKTIDRARFDKQQANQTQTEGKSYFEVVTDPDFANLLKQNANKGGSQRYGETAGFEQRGRVFIPHKNRESKSTVAHEMGHALGIPHVIEFAQMGIRNPLDQGEVGKVVAQHPDRDFLMFPSSEASTGLTVGAEDIEQAVAQGTYPQHLSGGKIKRMTLRERRQEQKVVRFTDQIIIHGSAPKGDARKAK